MASAWVCAAITACAGGRQPELAQSCAEPAGVASSGAEQAKIENRGRWVGVGDQAAGSGALEARVRDHARYMHGRDTNMRQCDMVLAVGAHGWTVLATQGYFVGLQEFWVPTIRNVVLSRELNEWALVNDRCAAFRFKSYERSTITKTCTLGAGPKSVG